MTPNRPPDRRFIILASSFQSALNEDDAKRIAYDILVGRGFKFAGGTLDSMVEPRGMTHYSGGSIEFMQWDSS